MRKNRPLLLIPLLLALEAGLYFTVGHDGAPRALARLAAALGLPYNSLLVLLGVGLLGVAAGIIGAFAVLRRRSLVGDAVAHASLPGLAVAFMIIGYRHFGGMLLGAILSGLLGTLLIVWLQRNTRIKVDAAIGIVLSVFYGAGIALSRIIQDDPSGRQAGLDSFLLGKTAGMVSQDVLLIAAVAANVLVFTVLLYKEFKLLSFDPAFAMVQGWPVTALDAFLLSLLVLTVVIGLPAVGVVLMAAMTIIPGVSARFWTDRLWRMLVLAGFFGLATGVLGALISSSRAEFPAGAVIVLTGAALFLFSMFLAPRRGVLARALSLAGFRLKVAREHLLRGLYELTESAVEARPAVTLEQICAGLAWRPRPARWLLWRAAARGDVERSGPGAWRLTARGLGRAAAIVNAHRLWETFLVEQIELPPDHVHRDADELEHLLAPELVARLAQERRRSAGESAAGPPPSVHPLADKG